MANFKNPLDDFRTYSYYHVLVACSNTEVAEALRNSSDILETGRANQSFEEKFSPKALLSDNKSVKFDVKKLANTRIKGRYVILSNGSTDTEFNIQNVKWTNLLYPSSDSESYTTMAVDGQMEIEEPRGARFMNIINRAVSAMGVDMSGVCFMLKTVFVGDNGPPITTVPPIIFLLYDIQATFDIVGSTYNINFIGMSNGVAKMKQFNQAPHTLSSLKVSANATLAQTLIQFQAALAKHYNDYYIQFTKDAKITSIGDFFQNYKLINYKITFDSVYQDGNKYKMDQFKDQNQTTINNEPTISFGDSPTIETALNNIMKHCGGVLEDGKKIPKQGEDDSENAKANISKKIDNRFGYKITSSVSSNDNVITVRYHISRYVMPTSSIIELAQNGDLETEVEKNNAILLDYIWTGKNRDILDFEMKMAMGLAFLQYLQTTENLPVDNASQTNTSSEQKIASSRSSSILGENISDYGKIKTVFYPPRANDKKEVMNIKKAASALEFNELLSRFASLEAIDAKVTIRGNPKFLSNITTLPSEVGSEPKKVDGAIYKKEFSNYDRIPPLCKIRIKMPSPDQAFRGNDNGIGSYEDFWYKGYYYIYSIENIFDGSGDFKQVLDIMSLPKELDTVVNDEKKDTQKIDVENTSQQSQITEKKKDYGSLSINEAIGICKINEGQ